MREQFFKEIDEQRDISDKETNTQTIWERYKQLYNPYSTYMQDEYVFAMSKMIQELQEKLHYTYINYVNEEL